MNSLPKLVFAVCLLAACSRAPDADPKPPEKTVFDPLLRQEQRAKDVQSAVDAATARARQAVEAEARGDAAPGETSPGEASRGEQPRTGTPPGDSAP